MSLDHCESVSFESLIGSLGRNDAGNYHSTAYGMESAIKRTERARVLEFILSYSEWADCVKLLSMPGLSWAFENSLLVERPAAQLVCLESSAAIYHQAKKLIPGIAFAHGHTFYGLQERVCQFGRATCNYARVTIHVDLAKRTRDRRKWGNCGQKSNRSNRLLHLSAATFATMLTTDYGATLEQKKDFNTRFYGRTAAWLDFTSNLCPSVEEVIQNLPFCMTSRGEKPVVISVLNARDSHHGVQSRIERILELQPALQYKTHWTYVGKNGSPMLTLCGTIV